MKTFSHTKTKKKPEKEYCDFLYTSEDGFRYCINPDGRYFCRSDRLRELGISGRTASGHGSINGAFCGRSWQAPCYSNEDPYEGQV